MNAAPTYTDTDDDCVHVYRRVHANGERTYVAVLSVGDSWYAAIAYDLDPAEFRPLAAEPVAFDPTLEGAVERSRRWMEQHPKGVLGGGGDGGTLGRKILGGIAEGARKLNEYGNEQMEDIQQGQQGGQQ